MQITKQALSDWLFESILMPYQSPEVASQVDSHYKSRSSVSFLAETLTSFFDAENDETIALKNAATFLKARHARKLDEHFNSLFSDLDKNLASLSNLYTSIKQGIEKLNLKETSEENAALKNLFKKMHAHTEREINEIIDYLIQYGISNVCSVGEQLRSEGMSQRDFLVICLEHFSHHKELIEAFKILSSLQNRNQRLLNKVTLNLFTSAPAQAQIIANLLLLLNDKGIYCPSQESNRNDPGYGMELIKQIHFYLKNIDHIWRDCKKNLPLSLHSFERILIDSNYQPSIDFENTINLIHKYENNLADKEKINAQLRLLKAYSQKNIINEKRILSELNNPSHNNLANNEHDLLETKFARIKNQRDKLLNDANDINDQISLLFAPEKKTIPPYFSLNNGTQAKFKFFDANLPHKNPNNILFTQRRMSI